MFHALNACIHSFQLLGSSTDITTGIKSVTDRVDCVRRRRRLRFVVFLLDLGGSSATRCKADIYAMLCVFAV